MVLLLLTVPGTLLAQEAQEKPASKSQAVAKSPSLAELARAARERRQHSENTVRTITNADLPRLKANVTTSTAPSVAAQPGEGDQVDGQPDATAENGSADELSPEELQKWKEAFDEARLNLRNAVSEGLVLQLRMNNLRNAFLRQSDGATQERIQGQLQETLDSMGRNRKAQNDARTAISRLQSDARAAGLSQAKIRELTGVLPEPPPDILSETTGTSDN